MINNIAYNTSTDVKKPHELRTKVSIPREFSRTECSKQYKQIPHYVEDKLITSLCKEMINRKLVRISTYYNNLTLSDEYVASIHVVENNNFVFIGADSYDYKNVLFNKSEVDAALENMYPEKFI